MSTTTQNLDVLAQKLTELWLFKKFDLRGRGRGQNRGQIYLGIV